MPNISSIAKWHLYASEIFIAPQFSVIIKAKLYHRNILLKKLNFINLLCLFLIFPPSNIKTKETAYNFHAIFVLPEASREPLKF